MDSTKLATIASFPFVKHIVKNSGGGSKSRPFTDKFKSETSFLSVPSSDREILKFSPSDYYYGPSYHQIHMVNGDILHNLGFRGQGKVIAILDAGFLKVNVLKAFDSLWQNNQILGTCDFVSPGSNVFEGNIHGMMVLSVIGGNYPGRIIGTAPKASFWLLRSENGNGEYIIEEYNWVCAAEFADSVGADIISSSLGYTEFDDITMNHTCADMDGHTTPATRGANIAALKGMGVIVSAGNEGEHPWRCVSAPSDGDNVLSIAAVDSMGIRAAFSSVGVDTNGRVKPNIAAMGKNDVVFWTNDSIVRSSGTSFSCPLIAGMTACLWQARPDVTPARLYMSIEESSSHYTVPDSLTGYGIPDFSKALNILTIAGKSFSVSEVFPNPFTNGFTIRYNSAALQKVKLEIYDIVGHLVYLDINVTCKIGENLIHVKNLINLSQGIYLVRLHGESFSESVRVIKSGY
jgi:subtilisin family serine protease